jgi:VWFA-related protein
MRSLRGFLPALLALLASGPWLGTPPSARADDAKARIAALAPGYRQWLEDVELLIGKDERAQFLALDKDYQRDGFIHRFWEARNPVPGASRNIFKLRWESRLAVLREEYGSIREDRARMRLLHGEPDAVVKTDCGMALWPVEIWHYVGGERLPRDLYLVFYQRGAGGPYRLWRRTDGLAELMARVNNIDPKDLGIIGKSTRLEGDQNLIYFAVWMRENCGGAWSAIYPAIASTDREDQGTLLDHVFASPPPRDAEWLASFRGVSTDLPPNAEPLPAKLGLAFPGRLRGRTVVQGTVLVPAAAATPADLEGHKSYNFLVSGEILQGTELAESFRYRFDLPAAAARDGTLPLSFERALAAGDYLLVLRIEDLHSHRNFRAEQPLAVPRADTLPEIATAREAPAVTAALEAARAELRSPGAAGEAGKAAGTAAAATAAGPAGGNGAPAAAMAGAAPAAARPAGEASVHLVPPPAEAQTGAVRLEARTGGEGIRKLTFFLDGKPMLSRIRPPFTVALNLEAVPVTHEVRVTAYDAAGRELASDTLTLNPPRQRFAVRLLEPRAGSHHRGQALVRAEVNLPDGASLDRLELFLDDQRVATLYQAPFSQVIPLPGPVGPGAVTGAGAGSRGGAARANFVRAVAYLAGGGSAEDLAVINSADPIERLDVRLVELSAAVLDRSGHPAGTLGVEDFKVLDGGEPQTLLRCERVRDLPLHLLFAIDTSASMAATLPQVQKAALAFLRRTLTPKDRAALLTFSDSPVLRTAFTNDLEMLGGALAGLNAERGTALWDSLVYGLTYMRGAQHGQSALVLFTDGGDHVSRLRFEEALEFARRGGIPIYTVGIGIPRLDLQDRGRLAKLASDTGGRSFFIDSAAELDGVHAAIEDELRSRYLLAYQPKAQPREGEFRAVEVRVAGEGLRVKTIRGYYP